MAITFNQSQSVARPPLSALSRLTIAALVGLAAAYGYLVVGIIGAFVPMIMIVPIALMMAGLIATGWRWAPLVAAILGIAGFLPETPMLKEHLDDDSMSFIINVILTPTFFTMGTLAGIGATVQHKRHAGGVRNAPRWLRPALLVVTGILVGGSIVAFRPHQTTLELNAGGLDALPGLAAENFRYSQPVIKARVGQPVALRLENTDSSFHRFDLDAFDVHLPMFHGDKTLAFFVPTRTGSFPFICNLPGHEEMKGTLIVEP